MAQDNHELISLAVGGDIAALQKLLMSQQRAITRYAECKLPQNVRDVMDPDDIVQQTFIEVFRSISRFRPEESFQAWLYGITDHVIKDAIKHHQRLKRGRYYQRVGRIKVADSQSVANLVDLLSAGCSSPSRSAMGHEAVLALTQAIEALPEDYRQAIQHRLLEGRTLTATAEAMNRSPRAVQGLVDRAKEKLRAALERLSKYK